MTDFKFEKNSQNTLLRDTTSKKNFKIQSLKEAEIKIVKFYIMLFCGKKVCRLTEKYIPESLKSIRPKAD
jgi:hypothetical protein